MNLCQTWEGAMDERLRILELIEAGEIGVMIEVDEGEGGEQVQIYFG